VKGLFDPELEPCLKVRNEKNKKQVCNLIPDVKRKKLGKTGKLTPTLTPTTDRVMNLTSANLMFVAL